MRESDCWQPERGRLISEHTIKAARRNQNLNLRNARNISISRSKWDSLSHYFTFSLILHVIDGAKTRYGHSRLVVSLEFGDNIDQHLASKFPYTQTIPLSPLNPFR